MSTSDSVNIPMEPLIEVRDLRVAFGERRRRFEAVRGVSFDIRRGETFGLVGESGSGKTSIGRAIIRVYQTAGGEIRYRGERISGRISRELDRQVTREIQLIFQDPMASLNERAKVDYIVSEGLYSVEKHLSREERQARVRKALEDVGLLPEFASRFPHEFSGGQRQRIGIARALVMNPRFIIADEPTTALDAIHRDKAVEQFLHLQEQGCALLLVTHDFDVARHVGGHVLILKEGQMVEQGCAQEVLQNPIADYTKELIEAIHLGWG